MRQHRYGILILAALLFTACGTDASSPAAPAETTAPEETVPIDMELLTPVPLQTETTPPEETAPPPPPVENRTPEYTADTDRILLDQENIWADAVRNAGFGECTAWYEDLDIGDNRLEWVVQDNETKAVLLFKADGDTLMQVTPSKWSMYGLPTAPPPSDPIMPSYVQYYLWDAQADSWRADIAGITIATEESNGYTWMRVFPRCIQPRETRQQIENDGKWAMVEYPLVQCRLDPSGLTCVENDLGGNEKIIPTEDCRTTYDSYITNCQLYRSQHGVIALGTYFESSDEQKAELLAQNRMGFDIVTCGNERPDNSVIRALLGIVQEPAPEQEQEETSPQNTTPLTGTFIRTVSLASAESTDTESMDVHPGDTAEIEYMFYYADNREYDGIMFHVRYNGMKWYADGRDIMLTPSADEIARCSDDELKTLASYMQGQYNSLIQEFCYSGGSLNLNPTGEYDGEYERLDPPATWEDLMREYRQFFTEDVVAAIPYSGETDSLSSYIREKNGSLWHLTGFGGPAFPTTYTAEEITSRTDDEIVFNMHIVSEEPDGTTSEYHMPFTLRLEDGRWKCARLSLIWFAV